MTSSLKGKVALVTGAARGQGRSHALRLAAAGADIIAVDICAQIDSAPYPLATRDDLDETVEAVTSQGRRIHPAVADVRDFGALDRALSEGVSALGRLDVVVANAGVTSQARTHELTETQWNDTIGVNLTGVWHTAKAAIPHLLRQGDGGSIVLVASTCASRGYENIAHYVASKHGVKGLMKTMAQELARDSIRVNCVSPTQVDTDIIMNESTFRMFSPHLENPTRADFAVASEATHVLPVPWLEPDDVSAAVLFLASDEARYITGADLTIDAGCLL
jgi:SDR family mycofactocin-dependent oxidoreductase